MLPTNYRLPTLGAIDPYAQGPLSNLCGVYAAINAARLLTPERATHLSLWRSGSHAALTALDREGYLEESILSGMPSEAWKLAMFEAYDVLSELTGTTYQIRPPRRRLSRIHPEEMPGLIQSAVSVGAAVLCALEGALNHYTVIAGYTATRWLLHDSTGLKWVSMDKVSYTDEGDERHYMPISSVLVVMRKSVLLV